MTHDLNNARDVLIVKMAEIDALLAKINAARADHFGWSPDDVNWGHVGSVSWWAEKLADVAASMASCYENNPVQE